MIREQWDQDPEFAALPAEEKNRILGNYFNSTLVDDEYKNLPKEEQDRIWNSFSEKEGIVKVQPSQIQPPVSRPEEYRTNERNLYDTSGQPMQQSSMVSDVSLDPLDQSMAESDSLTQSISKNFLKGLFTTPEEVAIPEITGSLKSIGKQALRFGPNIAKVLNQALGFGGGVLESVMRKGKEATGDFAGAFSPWEQIGNAIQEYGLNNAEEIGKSLEHPFFNLPKEKQKKLWDNPQYLLDPEWLSFNAGEAIQSLGLIVAATYAGGPTAGMAVGGGMEGLDLYGQLIKEGANEDNAASASIAFGIVTGFLNEIVPEEILKGNAGGILKKAAKRIALGTGEAVSEWAEEPFQAAFGELAKGKSIEEASTAALEAMKNIDVMPGAFIAGGGFPSIGGKQENIQRESEQLKEKKGLTEDQKISFLDQLKKDYDSGKVTTENLMSVKDLFPDMADDIDAISRKVEVKEEDKNAERVRGNEGQVLPGEAGSVEGKKSTQIPGTGTEEKINAERKGQGRQDLEQPASGEPGGTAQLKKEITPERRAELLWKEVEGQNLANRRARAAYIKETLGIDVFDKQFKAEPYRTSKALERPTTKKEIDKAVQEANTEPTKAQKEAGNYKKPPIQVQGLNIKIENPKGSERTGKDETGAEWKQKVAAHYGYFEKAEGEDGDKLDVFVGPKPESDKVYVIDQINPKTGEFDEFKVMMGFEKETHAKTAYNRSYEKGWKGLSSIREMSVDEFKTWMKNPTQNAKSGAGGLKTGMAEETPTKTSDRVVATPKIQPESKIKVQRSSDEAGEMTQYEIIEGPDKGSSLSRGALKKSPEKYSIDETLMPAVAKKVEQGAADQLAKDLDRLKKQKEKTTAPTQDTTEAGKPGMVRMNKGGVKPFISWREFKSGKNKTSITGKVEITFPNGKKVTVKSEQIREYPSQETQKIEEKSVQTTELTESGDKAKVSVNRIAERYTEIADQAEKHMPFAIAMKNARHLIDAIENRKYNDLLHPDNKVSRTIYEEFTGEKLPKGVTATKDYFITLSNEKKAVEPIKTPLAKKPTYGQSIEDIGKTVKDQIKEEILADAQSHVERKESLQVVKDNVPEDQIKTIDLKKEEWAGVWQKATDEFISKHPELNDEQKLEVVRSAFLGIDETGFKEGNNLRKDLHDNYLMPASVEYIKSKVSPTEEVKGKEPLTVTHNVEKRRYELVKEYYDHPEKVPSDVYFHGSKKGNLDLEKDSSNFGGGLFLAKEVVYAQDYAKDKKIEYVFPFKINDQNPFDIGNKDDLKTLAKELIRKYPNDYRYKGLMDDLSAEDLQRNTIYDDVKVQEILDIMGYDVVYNGTKTEALVIVSNPKYLDYELLTELPETKKAAEEGKAGEGEEGKKYALAESLFPESNRLTNIDKKGSTWQTIENENGKIDTSKPITVYRATIGNEIRPNDFVAINKSVAEDHLQNLKDRGENGKIIEQEVNASDLLMGNDATEFIYSPKVSEPEFKVKPPKKLYRGTKEGQGTGIYSMGQGIYSTPDKSFAKMYGKVEEIDPMIAFPRNPLELKAYGGAPQALIDWILQNSDFRNIREFNKAYPDPGQFVREKGYDGVIAGDEIVYYPESLTKNALPESQALKPVKITKEVIQNAFPNAKVREQGEGFLVILPNGSRIWVVANNGLITPDPLAVQQEYGRSMKQGEKALAAWQKLGPDGMMWLSGYTDSRGMDELVRHEVFHAAEDMVLSESQLRGIRKDYKTSAEAADAYAKWDGKQGKSIVSRVFTKIRRFFKRIANAFFPNAFDPETGEVFEDIRSGKIWNQPVKQSGFDVTKYQAGTDITQTQEFKDFFGKSKVTVDGKAGSEPLVVYHGTNEAFEEFKNQYSIKGYFFTDSTEQADKFSDRGYGYSPSTMPVYLSINNPSIINFNGNEFSWNKVNDAVNEAKKNGNDGVIVKNIKNYPDDKGLSSTYIAFEPTQIKSIYNRGTFDKNDPRISYALQKDPFNPEEYVNNIIKNANKEVGQAGTIQDAEAVEVNPNNTELVDKVYSRSAKDMLKPYYDKDGNFDKKKFSNDTGITMGKDDDPKDLYRFIRRTQTMQDLAKNYPEMKKLLDIEQRRQGNRDQMSIRDREITEPYFTLPNKSIEKVNKALIDGDLKGRYISNEVLWTKYGLSSEEKKGYWAIRKVLDEKLQMILSNMISDITNVDQEINPDDVVIAITKRNQSISRAKGDQSLKDQADLKLSNTLTELGFEDDQAEKIIKLASWAFDRRAYVPHSWEKEWRVKVTTKEGVEYLFDVDTFKGRYGLTRESRREAARQAGWETAIKNVGEENIDYIKLIRSRQTPIEISEAGSAQLMESILEAATNKVSAQFEKELPETERTQIQNLREQIKKTLEQLYLAKGWGRHLIGRKGVGGFRQDIHKVIPEYLVGFNGYVTKGKASREFADAMRDISPTETPEMWRQGKDFVSDMLGPALGEGGQYKRLVSLYFLAADVSAAALNMTQNWTHAVALLREIDGKGVTSEKEIYRAMRAVQQAYFESRKQGSFAKLNESKVLSPDEIKAFRQAYEQGKFDPKQFGERTGLAGNKIHQTYLQEAERLMYIMFTASESWNRMSTFLAGYRRAKRSGISDPYQKAVDIMEGAHFIYGKQNRPEIIRSLGLIGNVAFTFMTYPLNNIVFMKHRIENIIRPEQAGMSRKTALKVLGSNIAYTGALGGLNALPFMFLFNMLWKLFQPDPDKDPEKLIREHTSVPIGRAVTRGIPSVFGNDFSWRVEGTDILDIPIGFQTGKTIYKRFKKAEQLYDQYDYWGAIFQTMPDVLMNPYKAVIGYQKGGEERSAAPIKYTGYEAFTKGLGFTPTREAETYKAQELARTKREQRIKKVDEFVERYISIARNRDQEGLINLIKDFKAYQREENKKDIEGGGIPISWKKDIEGPARTRVKARTKGYDETLPEYMKFYQKKVGKSFKLEDYGR